MNGLGGECHRQCREVGKLYREMDKHIDGWGLLIVDNKNNMLCYF